MRDAAHAFAQGCVDFDDVLDKTSRAPDPNVTELKVPRDAQPKLDQHSQIEEIALERAQNELTTGKRALSNSHTYSHSCGNLAPLNGLQTAADAGTVLRTPSRPQDQRSRSSSPAPSSAARSFNEIECVECMLRLAFSTTPISEYGNRKAGQDVVADAGMQLIPWPSQEGPSSDTFGRLAPMEDTSLRQPGGWAQSRRSSSLDSISPARSTFDQFDNDKGSTTAPDMEEEEEWTLYFTTEAAFEQYFNGFVDIEAMLLHETPSV